MTRQQVVLLRMLRNAGGSGIHTLEMRQHGIGNPSQRMNELCDLGCEIERTFVKHHGVQGSLCVLIVAPDTLLAELHDLDAQTTGEVARSLVGLPPVPDRSELIEVKRSRDGKFTRADDSRGEQMSLLEAA